MYSFQGSPIYVSKKSAKNFWQDYRIFPDRIELRCWVLFTTFIIPAEEILDVEVRPPFSIGDIFRGNVKMHWWGLKLDWADICEHVEIHRKAGLFKYIRFSPDNPVNFVAACKNVVGGPQPNTAW
jgi:hypothetical protein